MDFTFKITEKENKTAELKLSGSLDEFAALPNDVDFSKYTSLYVDFNNLDFINSGGIKTWITFIDPLEKHPNLKIYFKNCRKMIVDQINQIEGILPKNGEVLSLYVPIFCNKCEDGFDVLQVVATHENDWPDLINRAKPNDCSEFPKCQREFEVDVVKERYFQFNN